MNILTPRFMHFVARINFFCNLNNTPLHCEGSKNTYCTLYAQDSKQNLPPEEYLKLYLKRSGKPDTISGCISLSPREQYLPWLNCLGKAGWSQPIPFSCNSPTPRNKSKIPNYKKSSLLKEWASATCSIPSTGTASHPLLIRSFNACDFQV